MNGKKTYLAALAAFVTALCAYLADGMDFKAALTLAFQAVFAATIRHGISARVRVEVNEGSTVGIGAMTTHLKCAPLAIVAALGLAFCCAGCSGPGGVSLALDPTGGVCIVRDGYALCYNPATKKMQARHQATGRVVVMEYDARSGDYTAALGSAEGTLVYTPTEGLRVQPGSGK